MPCIERIRRKWGDFAVAALAVFAALAAMMPECHAVLEVSSKRECAICHIMWLDEFNRKDEATLIPYNARPQEETGKQDAVSTERMCFSCHDGFVLDSRTTWLNRQNFHSVGVKPTDKVVIPKEDGKQTFPLNDDGKVYCGTCHSAHGIEWGEEQSPIFLRFKNKDSSICVACHLDRSTGTEEGNHPLFKEVKEIPESLLAAGAKFSDDGLVICQSCHLVHGAPEKKILVVKNERSELCGTCHSNRNPRDLAQAGILGTHPVNITPNKAKVPQSLLDKGAKLSPDGMMVCATCHKSHFAEKNSKILVARNPDSELCKACHVDQRKVGNTKHNIALLDEKARNIQDQEVGKSGVCSACHVPHGGSGPKMWAQQIKPGGSEPMADLCLSCHRDGGLADKSQVGTYTHPVGRDMSFLKETVDLPGFTREGVKMVGKNQGNVTCASCHDAHQWDPANPEKTSKPGDKTGDPSNSFLRKANGPDSPLCQVCHKDNARIRNTKHDMVVMFPNERTAKGQTSEQAGICGNCHTTHNGKGPRMWAREAVPGVEAASSICLNCHDSKGLAKDSLIGTHSHPVDVPMTNIGITSKDGKWSSKMPPVDKNQIIQPMPLFDKAGAPQKEGGNVACGTCHDPHNWSAVSRADEGKDPHKIKGSGETDFLRIPYDNKGTLCANCHVDKGPVNLSKHNLTISAPQEKNSKGKTTAESGVCGACHLVHNGNNAKMWARNNGTGKDEIEKECNSCHEKGQNAEKKLTGDNTHPLGVDLKKAGKTTLPLYTAEGKRDDAAGKVNCATCHNLHQWNPMDANSKDGATAEVEGDAANSFLRMPAWPDPELCVNCHQDQRWVKGTEHDLAVTGPDDTNALKQNRQQSGVCGSCHVPHNAVVKAGLWARTPGKGDDAIDGLCRSCHAEGKVAEAKQPVKYSHPGRVKAVSNPAVRRTGQTVNINSYFPVFTKDGHRALSGIITCSTCHNPHQWSAGKLEEGSGKNVEGDTSNSFLRNTSEYSLCTNCHGEDSLYRYKYYHAASSRPSRKSK